MQNKLAQARVFWVNGTRYQKEESDGTLTMIVKEDGEAVLSFTAEGEVYTGTRTAGRRLGRIVQQNTHYGLAKADGVVADVSHYCSTLTELGIYIAGEYLLGRIRFQEGELDGES